MNKKTALHTAAYVAIWICMSSSVILYNKYILAYANFPFPIALATFHLLFFTIATRILAKTTNLFNGLQALDITWEIYLKAIIPIGLLFSANLIFCNYAYLYLSVAFIQMVKATTPVLVLIIGWCFQIEKPDRLVFVNAVIIVIGVVVACYGEIEFVLTGFIFQALGVTVEAMRLVGVRKLLISKNLKMDPLCSLYYFAPVSVVFSMIVFFIVEYSKIKAEDFVNVGAFHFLLNAFVFGASFVLLISQTSSLVLTISSVLNDILLILVSIILYASHISLTQIFGYCAALFGLFRLKTGGSMSTLTLPLFVSFKSPWNGIRFDSIKRAFFILVLISSLGMNFIVFDPFYSSSDDSFFSKKYADMCTASTPCPFVETKCKYVYFDVGSNVGIQVRKLYEPEKFPGSPFINLVNEYFGKDGNDYKQHTCAIGFEPNPAHHESDLNHIQATYSAIGWRTIFYRKAASNLDGTAITFFNDNAPEHKFWGASILPWNGSKDNYTVNTIGLGEFIKNFIAFHQPESVLMKLDIEASEFTVLPVMMDMDAFCDVDLTFVEWHDGMLLTEEAKQEAVNTRERLERMRIEGHKRCKGWKFLDLDDETYGSRKWDGGPFAANFNLEIVPFSDICKEYGFTRRPSNAKVFDFLLVNDEISTLYLRMEQMHRYVDKFIILESEKSFSSMPKRLYFSENRQMFDKFNILHLVLPAADIPAEWGAWEVEHFTRNYLFTASMDKLDLAYNDVILISDLDEIPKPKTLDVLKTCYFFYPITLTADFYFYSYEFYGGSWPHPQATMFKGNHELSLKDLRDSPTRASMPKASWHCSYCFSTYEQFARKIEYYSHQEFNNDYYKNRTRISDAVRSGKNWMTDNQFEILKDNNDIPEFLINNSEYWYMTHRYNQTKIFEVPEDSISNS